MAKKKKAGNMITVDFTGVEAGGVALPEGQYEVKVIAVEQKESSEGNAYLSWEFEVMGPKSGKGRKLYHNTSLQQQSLWSLRGLLELLGVEIPEEPTDIDLDDLIDRTVGAEVQNETYNGKKRNRIVDFFEFEEGSEEEEDEEEEKPSKKKASKRDDEDEEEEASEDEEEEEEAPKKKSKKERREEKKSKKKAKTYTEDEVLEKDEEELEELISEHELDIDLSDFNTLRRKRAAVLEALEEKGLIEEA